MTLNQSDWDALDLALLKALVAEYKSRKPMLGYYGEGIEVDPDQLGALIEAAEERDYQLELVKATEELARTEEAALTARYERVVEAARQIGGCVDCWNADDSFMRLHEALAALDAQ